MAGRLLPLLLPLLLAVRPAQASFNLTWGELREATGTLHAPRGPGASLDDLVPACGDWHSPYSQRRPNEPSLCITHPNCTRASCHLLFELDEAVTDRPTTISPPLYSDKPSQSAVWGWGMLSVGIISLSGIFGGLLWPVLNSRYYSTVMRFLIGLAAGSLTATSIFQLIPESLNMTQPGSQSHLDTGLIMLTSIWLLYFGETACKIFFSHDKAPDAVAGMEKGTVALKDMSNNHVDGHLHLPEADGLLPTPAEAKKKASHGHSHGDGGSGLAAVAWMVVLGDGLHNFVDGMSIGAGYTQSIGTGVSISLAIACEEFPHELGDFAILINSGVSFRRALALNFGSACTAFGGLVLGVVLGEVQYSYLIFAFAGGLFLYIALGSLTPELKTMVDEELESKGRSSAALALSLQLLGVGFGATALYLITRYNDSIRV
ncbi:metal cation symporter ZIP8-like isoform X2 [Thrips palmi]|uniref:Metal cation symporter ZIP8-like isoform X2 n=1 Tax=Thrips palmi TaxID=161013 RepID=A0A6P8Y4H9_THRPL|nr:metal cation symporter ZIP8-like isoform X2 [Thrips palmi]